MRITPNLVIPASEIKFQFGRSTGPGGQNVNKVSTRVDLVFDVANSHSLGNTHKQRIMSALRSRISADGILRVTGQRFRSQWRNREEAMRKLSELLRMALARRKKRVGTKPSPAGRERRIQIKKLQGLKKKLRSGVRAPDDGS